MVPNNRTTDTRIFSRTRDRFLFNINELEVRNQSVLRSMLWNPGKLRFLSKNKSVPIYNIYTFIICSGTPAGHKRGLRGITLFLE